MQISGFFPCIGLAIWGKISENHVHTWLFCKQSHMWPQMRFSRENINQTSCFLCRMVLEWREGEHGDVEVAVQGDLMAQQALRACGLYKF